MILLKYRNWLISRWLLGSLLGKLNGMVKSIIDRVLVSKEWLKVWPNCQQFVLSRSISDNCAVILKEVSVDWGPKPFRCLDVW